MCHLESGAGRSPQRDLRSTPSAGGTGYFLLPPRRGGWGVLLEFEAVAKFSDDEKKMVKGVLKGLILKHESERY